ncbi:hypothetical protein [Halobacillus litoralis]|uniref:hypothetical protein n=1 Tax=Halobacillus litoralis TaxID=45668 RepID=UPI001CD42677|nr:hypothetical protein [Halobacillus litoralis]MCA1021546.1 hypothetical protein [Halobacillus litoralis]
MGKTGLKDKFGKEILLGDEVKLDGKHFEVVINDFNKRIVIDGDTGQEALIKVYKNCEVVSR